MKQSTFIFLVLFSTLFVSSIYVHSSSLKATLTINDFEKGGACECDGKYHSNDTPIVALSTQWYNHGQRCFKYININFKDKSVQAMVVDECDSTRGCKDNIMDKSQWGETEVTW